MTGLREIAQGAKTILIAGHLRPDGDCVGAAAAAYLYLKKIYPEAQISAYVEKVPEVYRFLDPEHSIFVEKLPEGPVDLFLSLDSSTKDRLGEAERLFDTAGRTACIDHHVSNLGYARENFVEAGSSSACEVLYELMEEELIDTRIAEAIYIGIIMDTGVFRYSNTSKKTMEIAGSLMEKGVPFWKYIDECFYQRTYTQTQLLGRTLLTSMRLMDGRVIVATVTRRMLEFYGAQTEDIEGIIDQLRVTKGVEVALLLQEIDDQQYKVSMRSNTFVDVSKIAVYFGGGGHVKAAGCTMRGSLHDVVNNITEHIEFQME
ncbi:DHH family phosphoesterase [Jutongia huaianensis]|uniref:Bifunctional oligoribonuclease/PAP phosphatase NrnA n=1 Tax=Jutongia huaianensis TaxID=2763668 RepID=A0ABR7N2S3_9FIRM|nr:bifunctional oligoribonuclease/PAP phosphatase NrnA [Jutongia huaianensis]MBC8562920.1 bifunctional oligoribonuclease/PAP phosphatase NrnA [Jutongia huaianensis]